MSYRILRAAAAAALAACLAGPTRASVVGVGKNPGRPVTEWKMDLVDVGPYKGGHRVRAELTNVSSSLAHLFVQVNLVVVNALPTDIWGMGPNGEPLSLGGGQCTLAGTRGRCNGPPMFPGQTMTVDLVIDGLDETVEFYGDAFAHDGAWFVNLVPHGRLWLDGVIPPTTVRAHVGEDLDASGTLDPGEPGIPGIRVCLDVGSDGSCDGDPGADTDAGGDVSFLVEGETSGTVIASGFEAEWPVDLSGHYPGYALTAPTSSGPCVSSPCAFGLARHATIQGTARYLRFGPDGLACPIGQQENDAGSACEPCPPDTPACSDTRTVALAVFDAGAGTFAPLGEAVPGSDGVFVFDDLDPGLFRLDLEGDEIYPGGPPELTLRSGQTSEPVLDVLRRAELVVTFFADLDQDGVQDAGEPGVTGGTVGLTDPRTSVEEEMPTDASGQVRFVDLLPGRGYAWRVAVQPPGQETTGEVSGVVDLESASFRPEGVPLRAKAATLPGVAFNDRDGDGVRDPDEEGFDGLAIRVEDDQGTLLEERTTRSFDADASGAIDPVVESGLAEFTVVTGRSYRVRVIFPEGLEPTGPTGASRTVVVGPDDTSIPVQEIGARAANGFDYGDAPEIGDALPAPYGYPVSTARDGARHLVLPALRLGERIDGETDGVPDPLALSDDAAGVDDEDGIAFGAGFVRFRPAFWRDPAFAGYRDVLPGLLPGTTGRLVVRPSVAGQLDAWIDWNRDGDWDDRSDRIFESRAVNSPSDTLSIEVPGDAEPGFTYARFRFSASGGLDPGGVAYGGEVEDYLLVVLQPLVIDAPGDTPDQAPGDGACNDGTGACTLRAAIDEANAADGIVVARWGAAGKQGGAVVSPLSPLPAIRSTAVLDLTGVELDGSLAGAGADGLVVEADGVVIRGAVIGGFGGHGVVIDGSGNSIETSRISGNGGDGVRIVDGRFNTIRGTTFDGNGGLGIDLGADGPGAPDGPPAPALTLATAENGRVAGSVISAPDSAVTVELYASPTCDASGFGEGDRLLATLELLTDGAGTAPFETAIPGSFTTGDALTATATGPLGGTSEFSACLAVVTTGVEQQPDEDLPTEYTLAQNYPNPFNPTTRIGFSLPERTDVRLTVHDLLGRTVAILVDGPLAAGWHEVVFEAGWLPSGLYVYRLRTPAKSLSRPMMLAK